MIENQNDLIEKKIRAYSEKQIAVHIVKKNAEWLNGPITEVSEEFFIIDEFKKGQMPVFYSEISYVETYKKEDIKKN